MPIYVCSDVTLNLLIHVYISIKLILLCSIAAVSGLISLYLVYRVMIQLTIDMNQINPVSVSLERLSIEQIVCFVFANTPRHPIP